MGKIQVTIQIKIVQENRGEARDDTVVKRRPEQDVVDQLTGETEDEADSASL